MPGSRSHEMRDSEGAVREAVIRLSRPDGEGGAVIERAAIVAEGSPASAIEAWIIDHGGQPEAPTIGAHAPGLYGLRPEATTGLRERAPRRYVLPAAALEATR
jgi:hypothetical protein